MSNNDLSGVNITKANDVYNNAFIVNDDDSLVWKYINNSLVSGSNSSNYLNASYTWALGYYYDLNINNSNQSWLYKNGGLYANYSFYLSSQDLYVYLDDTGNIFKCNDSNNKAIEIYEKSDYIVVDYYQSTNTGGGE